MPRVRLELVADFGPRRGQTFSGIVVETTYDAIVRAALNKLKVKKKEDLLLVLRDRYQGSRLLSPAADLGTILHDGATIVLTTQRPTLRLPPPPRWPWPTQGTSADVPAGAGGASGRTDPAPGGAGLPPETHSGARRETAPPGETQPAMDEDAAVIASRVAHAGSGVVVPSGASHETAPPGETQPAMDEDAAGIASRVAHMASGVVVPQADDDEWCGPWPLLRNDVLPLLRRAIANVSGFLEKDMGDYIAFDYKTCNACELPAMFPDPQALARRDELRLLAAVRRECRGLLVCSRTGAVLARRLPKFFNIDEVEESRAGRLPRDGGVATRKLDGSLVSPFLVGGAVRWAGKAALVPAVERFVAGKPAIQQVAELVRGGSTPVFEWCEAGPPVGVIAHGDSRLCLVAVRHNATGHFWPDHLLRQLGCEVVERLPFDSLPGLAAATGALVGHEGAVVSWPAHGCMVKIKSAWWVSLAAAHKKGQGQPALALHGALRDLPLGSVPPALVWQATLAGDDDQMSMVYGRLEPAAQAALRTFSGGVEGGVQALSQELQEWAECAREATEADIAGISGGWPPALLAAYQRRAPTAKHELLKFLARMAAAGQLRALEALTGTAWDAGGGTQATVDLCGHLGSFDEAPQEVVAHVLGEYLPRKLQEYLCHPVSDDTAIKIARHYEASEGKIRGMWEQFARQGIIDLRIDLQPRDRLFNFHFGDADYAHWQVQYGPSRSCPQSTRPKDGDRRGAFAGVLLRTDEEIEFRRLREAFEESFRSRAVVRLGLSPPGFSHVYLDLDGVLADFDAGFQGAFGRAPDDPKATWRHIEDSPGFFETLPWMEGAARLWRHLRRTGLAITVLTGVPDGPLGARSADEKRRWAARELGPVDVVTCPTREKPSFSAPGRLLVDGRPQKGWEAAGGRQIVHRSARDTLSAFADLGLGRPFEAPGGAVSVVDRVTADLQAAKEHAALVAVSAEWPRDVPGEPPSKAVLLQLAFQPSLPPWSVFVVDMLSWDGRLEAFTRDLLAGGLPKLVFGPEHGRRLGMPILAATDLQEGHECLAAQARKAGLLVEPRDAQAEDWSARPLPGEHLVRAATDALVLLELSGAQAAEPAQPAPARGQQAEVEYVAVFLTAASRRKLLALAPPRFEAPEGDRMILARRPASVSGLAVGATLKLRVEGAGHSGGVQAVRANTIEDDPRTGSVTISRRPGAADDADVGGISYAAIDEPFVLEGVLGVGVVFRRASQSELPEKVQARLLALTEGRPGQCERFEGLTASQRGALHAAAEELGLEHRSEGKKGTPHRKLTIVVPQRWKKPQAAEEGERLIVKDPKKFAAHFGDAPGLRLHGRLTRGGISWEPGAGAPPVLLERLLANAEQGGWQPQDRLVVILRGFPGSGKSSLAALLRRQVPLEVVSADDFFTGPEHVADAHEQCHRSFLEALGEERPVVVDNTNVRRSDYAFYRAAAEAAGYAVVVLELACDSTAELEQLRRRSVHGVPGGSVGAMWARWEQDPAALRLAPYRPQELVPWLREQGLLRRMPHTHLVMPSGPLFGVPGASRAEFLRRFEAEWGCHHIAEEAPPQAFRLFFDVDGLEMGRLLAALAPLRGLVGAPLVVTGTAEPPAPGYHIFVPTRTVDSAEALSLMAQWLQAVPELEGYVDGQLYWKPHLRMLGARKCSKEGFDLGRVHEVLGRFDDAWLPGAPWEWSDVTIQAW